MSMKASGWNVRRKFNPISVQRRDGKREICVIGRKRREFFLVPALRVGT